MKTFLTYEEIQIGTWWEIAQGGEYGYCVIGKNDQTKDIMVLSTCGENRTLDYFILQYRYRLVVPNCPRWRIWLLRYWKK